jgi:ribosomal protein L24E
METKKSLQPGKTKMYFAEDDDIMDICRDDVFKAVFTRDTPESQKALAKLVSALTGREMSVVTINANEPANKQHGVKPCG